MLVSDGKEYDGVIIGKDPKSDQWITRFECGSMNKSADPVVDADYTYHLYSCYN